jgi:hypothetical protein
MSARIKLPLFLWRAAVHPERLREGRDAAFLFFLRRSVRRAREGLHFATFAAINFSIGAMISGDFWPSADAKIAATTYIAAA